MTNYIFNKNLLPGGSPQKFIRWVEILQPSYPENAVMCLFLCLAHILAGQKDEASQQASRLKKILSSSDYWTRRFKQFSLGLTVKNLPSSNVEAQQAIQQLRSQFESVFEKL